MIRLLSVTITGPLERYGEGLLAHLLSLQYTHLSARNLLRVFAHLSRWLAARKLEAQMLTEKRVVTFLRSRRRAGYTGHCGQRALDTTLEYLRGLGVAPVALRVAPRTSFERLLARYVDHLTRERALASSTIRQRVDIASRFLRRGSRCVVIRALRVGDVRAFLRRMGRIRPKSLAGVGSDLRSLLRFLFLEGLLDRDLSPAVPSSVGWCDRTLPRGVSSSDLQRMLESCDRRTLTGKRDYAILLLLARLGLRQGEICALRLDDLDWERGEMTIHGKGRKRALLPIPADIGHALSAYLLCRRRGTSRHVFSRVRAPYRALQKVGAVVFGASQRAGVDSVWPHLLRHTAATEMLGRGASLSEIAQVLRHASTQTTTIYAKVDRRALRALAQPWPGARS
jgi:integrase/recombinase XerD